MEQGNPPPFSLSEEHVAKYIDHNLGNCYGSELHVRITRIISKHVVLSRSLYKAEKDICALMDFINSQRQVKDRDLHKTSIWKFYLFLQRWLYGQHRGNQIGRLFEEINEMCSWALYTELNCTLPTNSQRGHRSRLPTYQFTLYGMSIKVTDIYNKMSYSYSTFRRSVSPHWITASFRCNFHFLRYPLSSVGRRLLDAMYSEVCHVVYFARSVCTYTLDDGLCLNLFKQSLKFLDKFSAFVSAEKKKSAEAVLSRFVDDGMQMGGCIDRLLYAPPDGLMFLRAMEKWLTL